MTRRRITGLFGTRGRALVLYLLAWTLVFPIQIYVVHRENADDINVAHFVVNALILALSIGLNRIASLLRGRARPGPTVQVGERLRSSSTNPPLYKANVACNSQLASHQHSASRPPR